MKARIATVLSLTGVLVAGSAAALVNNQVLQSAQPGGAAGSRVTLVIGSPVPVLAEPEPTSPSSLPSSSVPLGQPVLYQVGDAGAVTLGTAGDVLSIVSATPNAGWTVLVAESIDAYNIHVQLQAGATLVEFRANLMMGVVVTSVESRAVDPSSTAVAVTQPPSGGSTATTGGSRSGTPGSTATTVGSTAGAPATTVGSHSSSTTPSPGTTDHDDDSDDGTGGPPPSGGGGGDDD